MFRQMVQLLRGKGGVVGLKAERAEAATANALKHLLPAKTAVAGGALQPDRHGRSGFYFCCIPVVVFVVRVLRQGFFFRIMDIFETDTCIDP